LCSNCLVRTGSVKLKEILGTILGEADDLENFLFATSRQSLVMMAESLGKLDGTSCFYCAGMLTAGDVDHFVPNSQYPRDRAHNFVLAHPSFNRSKSATLAAK
jgi:5-methylcytosine-specific restriction endonuclease McrA